MKSRKIICAALAAILFNSVRAYATIDLFDIDGRPVVLSASEQSREEVWNWFPANSRTFDNRYNFLGSWIRVGAGYERDGVKVFGEVMSPFFINLPDNAIAPPPQGLLGLGANYYQRYMHPDDASVFLKQGYVKFGRKIFPGLAVKGGRFEFFDGAEYAPKELNPQLKWLNTNRLAQRLIGNFGFSDVMRSFDGAVVSYGDERWQATAMYGVPTKGVFDLNGMEEIKRSDLLYTSINVGPQVTGSELWGQSMARLFYIYYSDTRGLALADNSGAGDKRPVSIDTVGGDYARVVPTGHGTIDFLLWGATQFGVWGTQDQQSFAVAAEAGYRFDHAAWRPWVRTGYTEGSGDGTKHDDTHGTFFQILPTPRLYAMTPFFNMMNLRDVMAQLIFDPIGSLQVQASMHGLWLDSSQDLWYAGGGEYDNHYFGYTGRPTFGHAYLGTLADWQLTWKVNEQVSTQIYYGHIFGGNVIGSVYPNGREGDFGYVQMTFAL